MIILSITFAFIRYLMSNQKAKWSQETKTLVMGICAFQYVDLNHYPKNWSLSKIKSEDKIGFKKILNCSIALESKYEPKEFFDIWKSNTDKITDEARIYLH